MCIYYNKHQNKNILASNIEITVWLGLCEIPKTFILLLTKNM